MNGISTKSRAVLRSILIVVVLSLLPACSLFGGSAATKEEPGPVEPAAKVERFTGEKSREIDFVYTARKELSLTFNGMGDKQTMQALLNELDTYNIKATFFFPG